MRKETYTKGDFSKASTKALFTGVKTKKQVLESVARSIEIEPINKFAALAVTEWSVVEIKEFLDGMLGSDGSGHPEPVISWEDIAQEGGGGCGLDCEDGSGGGCGAGCGGEGGWGCGYICSNPGNDMAIDVLGESCMKSKQESFKLIKSVKTSLNPKVFISTFQMAKKQLLS